MLCNPPAAYDMRDELDYRFNIFFCGNWILTDEKRIKYQLSLRLRLIKKKASKKFNKF